MSTMPLQQDARPLSAERHANYYLNPTGGYGFARDMALLPVLERECADLVHDYVVAFLRSGDQTRLVALLGLGENENLYLDADDRWQADYVPAMLRQYPFVAMMEKGSDRGILAIAESYAGLNENGQGTALFDADGRPGDLVSRAQKFVADVAQGALRTEAFCARLADLDLLVPIRLEMKKPDGTTRQVGGIQAVDRKRLAALDAETLHDLNRTGMLESLYLHLLSLKNLNRLAARLDAAPDGGRALN